MIRQATGDSGPLWTPPIPLIARLKDDKDEKVRDMASRTIRELSNK